MQSPPGKSSLKFIFKLKKKESEVLDSSLPGCSDSSGPDPIDISSPVKGTESQETKEGDDEHESKENTSQKLLPDSNDDSSKQLVVYDPLANGVGEIVPIPDHNDSHHSPFPRNWSNQPSKILPSVGAFTVQCASCFKWRLIPTKEKYEEIREHILENPFYCETAREWRPDISCSDPEDISQDGSRVWAIDKPNIAQPPSGWQRLLRIRGEGGTKFADVYYVAPSGKRLRSMVEVQKYLIDHPEYVANGVSMSQFSFQIPRPLQENYVKKRPPRVPVTHDGYNSLEPRAVRPLAWAGPEECTELQLGMPGVSSPSFENSALDLLMPPKKKKKKKKLVQHNFGLDEPSHFRDSSYNV